MKLVLKGANVFCADRLKREDVFISDGMIVPAFDPAESCRVIDFTGKYIFPGFTDVHVHLREPGFSYKETMATGTAAAARGGFTTLCSMPNLNPSPDGREGLAVQLETIAAGARVRALPVGAITRGSRGEELADFEEMPEAVAFSDDGHGTTADILRKAMTRLRPLGKLICSHCEDINLKGGDHIDAHAPFTSRLGIAGISRESEYVQLERELEAVAAVGGRYHMCHLSCRESVELIRRAKAAGLDVSCETAPHYLALDYTSITSDDGRFKMNPPLRSPADREAIIEGLRDGTIDMIATDHAPHSAAEKSRGLIGSAMGVVGLETAFAVCYTLLVKTNIISLPRLVELMSTAPEKRFGITIGRGIGFPADITVFDLEKNFTVDPSEFLSLGKSTPFSGKELFGECLMTICNGKIVYERNI